MLDFSGQLAVVTGASRGIGREIARALAERNAHIAAVATTLANAQATVDAIASVGQGKKVAFGCNVAEPAQVEDLAREVQEQLGVPSVLVNNAGITRDTLILRMSEDDWDLVLAVNLKGAFLTTKAFAKVMMKARYGRIINISSVIGQGGGAGQANYAASKAGLIGLSKSVAKEFGSRGITCNVVAPGFIETDMTSSLPEEFRQKVTEQAPAGRLGEPADIAPAVVFLASREAAYITGQVLTVDGGLTL